MFHYLYYKLYQASLKSSLNTIPEFMTPISYGGLLSANFLVINGFLAKITNVPFLFSIGEQGAVFAFIIIGLTMLYFRKKRYIQILKKYSQESNKERIRGNAVVAIYVALSFLLIFAIAFFKVR